ncbi:unnamed protein product [Miscanthus lutarioriparius]|uniref:MI domain-containing protein n=1 Tax=Miscanthus lutarioriparius TaxID=422564 RepID=A0A811RZU2_9POAL|nr:unnamed protein product [Miscanthus lutarioriparius]
MAGKSEQKSRKERRKEARSEKHKLRFLSWVEHQGGKKKKPAIPVVEPSPVEEKKPKKEPDGMKKKKKKRKREAEGKPKPKSNFQEYLEMEMGGAVSMEEDLEMERKLAKKLKVKKGKLGGPDDGMDELFVDLGFGGDFGSDDETKAYDWNVADDTNLDKKKGKKKNKKAKKDDIEMEEPDDMGEENGRKKKKKMMKKAGMEMKELDDVGEENGRKRKKKMEDDSEMNEPDDEGVDMDEENGGAVLESEDGEPNVVELPTESKGKYVPPSLRNASNSESEEIAQMCRRVRGLLNRLSESNVESITQEIATLFRSVPRSVGSQIIRDEVLASCSRGPRGNEQYAAVFAAFVAGLVGIDFSAKILASIAKSFEDEYSKEDGLSLRNLTLLFCYLCIFGVISRVPYPLFLSLSEAGNLLSSKWAGCGMKLREDDPGAMKDFVLSIQNSLKAEDVLLRGLTWSRLLDPDKKGQWWLSGNVPSTVANVEDVAAVISKDVVETQKLLQLAAAQWMNTDIRRAIFCIIMSAEDYDRGIIRVIVDCCLHEKMFNKYYTVLASKLCNHEKNHKFSLQYCIWDHFKELDNMESSRSMDLAKLVAEMLSNFTLSLATLKVVNLANPVEMTPARISHFQMLFETLLQKDDARHVIADDTGKDLAGKFKIAKKALDNTAGVLM